MMVGLEGKHMAKLCFFNWIGLAADFERSAQRSAPFTAAYPILSFPLSCMLRKVL